VPRRMILLDACVAINLAATGRLEQIASALNLTFVIAAQAAAEAGHLRDTVDGELVLRPINLEQHESSQAVKIVNLGRQELVLYVELAAIVDDGEAATIAIAITRGLELATDDRKARKLCQERQLAEPLRTTALLRSYADSARLTHDQIQEIIAYLRDRASFQPARTDPEIKWWNDHADG
jgi:predicted nucleic acid-binding protein